MFHDEDLYPPKGSAWDMAEQQVAKLEAEIKRLKAEGQPGVMHPVDQAFYRLAVKERDHERQRVDRLAETVGRLREERDELRRLTADQRADYAELQAENRRLRAGVNPQ